ncbi:hypothetical protein PoB_002087900 [Plakobranchus ocellatus]|uniref:Apple domain-containing protein n=1 Tax=Plakobranchus ocellatus TaxID=259542 RepID=A0AAV3ZKH6_9GAST|nr:hypothetical protein PoB_002087900 [Plakobranchus ocellatus]
MLASRVWDDGTVAAPDIPWKNQLIRPCGRLTMAGNLGMISCNKLRYPACGNHSGKAFEEAQGLTYHSTAPTNVTASLSVSRVDSYLQCALLCSSENLCRAAHFDLVTRNCEILGPGSFSISDFQVESASTTFVRRSFGEIDGP